MICSPGLIVALSAAVTVVNVGVIVAAAVIVKRGNKARDDVMRAVAELKDPFMP